MPDEMREMFSWLASTDRDLLVVLATIALLAGGLRIARGVALLIGVVVLVVVNIVSAVKKRLNRDAY